MGLGKWHIYLTRQLCLSSWEGVLQEWTRTGSPEGVEEGRVMAQAQELGRMDAEAHFWNLQGIGLLGGEV